MFGGVKRPPPPSPGGVLMRIPKGVRELGPNGGILALKGHPRGPPGLARAPRVRGAVRRKGVIPPAGLRHQ